MQHLLFSQSGDVTGAEIKAFLQQECVKHGVLFVGYHHPSFAHSEQDIAITLDVYDKTFALLSLALRKGDLKTRLAGKPIAMAGVRQE
jgi:hypothetical protein